MLDLEGVVAARVGAKVLGLVGGHGLVAGAGGAGRGGGDVVLGVGAEGADLDLVGADGAVRVHDDGDEGVVERLLHGLGVDVDAAEPAAVARVAVVPAHGVLDAALAPREVEVLDEILVGVLLRVDAGLGAFDGEPERVRHHDRRAVHVALHETHHLERAARPGVHDHLDQRHGADAHRLEVVGVPSPGFGAFGGFGGPDVVVVEAIALRVGHFRRRKV